MAWRERSRLVRWWRLWRTRRPRTFTEKVRYKMLRDHRELMVTFADKAAVRDHVAAVAGTHVLPRLLHLSDDPASLAGAALPTAYVLKPTHGSGVAVVVSPDAPAEARLPDPPGRLGLPPRASRARPRGGPRGARRVLARAAHGQGPNREWAYGLVPRHILVEELLVQASGEIYDELRAFVFHGRSRYVQVDRGRFRTPGTSTSSEPDFGAPCR